MNICIRSYCFYPERWDCSKMCVKSLHVAGLLSVIVIFITWQTPSLKYPKSGWHITLYLCTCAAVCTGAGKRLHTLLSHPTLGEPQVLSWGLLTNCMGSVHLLKPVCMSVSTGPGKRLHTLLSHPTVGEPQDFSRGTLTYKLYGLSAPFKPVCLRLWRYGHVRENS